MTVKTYTCYVVFQTHWDREWYLPFEVYRHRLTQVIDRIVEGLENNELEQFVLDGQMAALEDYLEVCEPYMEERILSLIKEKKIIIGPWYVLADEFLVSGESLIRNLEIGMKLANKYGESQMVGYLPDTFGHVSQMPQLLKGFGIDNAIAWRGIDSDKSELIWKAPDGSQVLTVFLPEGYYQPVLNEESYQTSMANYVEKVKGFAQTSALLLTNGGDHLMPKHGDMLGKINEISSEEVTFVSSTYEHYLTSLKAELPEDLPVYYGELRSNKHAYVLPNVLSTRTYLKQQNQMMEDELTGYTEPLLTLTASNNYPARYLEESWKLLMKNHPHDSICGCSLDEVHREMETRTMKLGQRLESLQMGALAAAGIQDAAESGHATRKPFEDNTVFTVFNPHVHSYSGPIRGTIWLKEDIDFSLVDEHGQYYQPTILSKRKDRHFASPLDAFPEFTEGTFYEVIFSVEELPATSLTTFRVVEGEYKTLVEMEAGVVDTAFYRINVETDGSLTLEEKTTGRTYKGLQSFYSSLDVGDEYTYSPPKDDIRTFGRLKGNPKVDYSGDVSLLHYTVELEVPAGCREDRTGPVEEKVTTEIQVTVMLTSHSPRIESKVKVLNRAQDQRLRVQFPLGATIEQTYSDTAFDVVKRPAKKIEEFDAPKQKEVPVVVEPSLSFIRAEQNGVGIHFFHRGLQEYQVVPSGKEDILEVTVLRSVGWLSRDDLRTRGGGAGPGMETPEGQCLGTYTFDIAFEPASGCTNGNIAKSAHFYRIPPRIYPGDARGKNLVRLVEIDNKEVQWSALYCSDGEMYLRLWNPTKKEQAFQFSTGQEINTITKVNMDKSELILLNDQSDRLSPKGIANYRLQFS
ncbi:glycoside hydrolase family 38 [Sutcliffiella horikoshii]|uniref:Glycoside hydrolase family 38 n=1 Tax=Sutcliffiella horikoshii TaxID=79883 RepID=A0A5D4T559_9BACI|nr:glycoside hydrolase family 38 C-terminal domain-containing protein [Sutcliffiella horikoshii]TYS69818.1 glycoside hydrolase family 38 [Sutcliffiella horikoshii]